MAVPLRLLGCIVTSACLLAATAQTPLILRGAVGEVSLGASESALLARYGERISETTVAREGRERALLLRLDGGGSLILELDESQRVWAIRVHDPSVRTRDGIGVGSTLAEVRRAYPSAEFSVSDREGGYLSAFVPALNGFFSFERAGEGIELLGQLDSLAARRVVEVVIHGVRL